MSRKQLALLEPTLVRQALLDAVKKLSPMVQWRNPVMFIGTPALSLSLFEVVTEA